MSIISWIILGLIAGFIGSKIVNAEGQGFWLNIALGIIGALVGGFLRGFFLGIYPNTCVNARSGLPRSTCDFIAPDCALSRTGSVTRPCRRAVSPTTE
jgi:uncharacterized membrane protein YeaQ/YmgE (transglycosylase-associated protein family)